MYIYKVVGIPSREAENVMNAAGQHGWRVVAANIGTVDERGTQGLVVVFEHPSGGADARVSDFDKYSWQPNK
jgi:hypothetical protein